MADLEPSGFSQIDHLLQLVGRTRELLDAVVHEGELPVGGADYLADTTLPHLEGVEAGFHGTLRSEHAELAELRYLLARVGTQRVTPPQTEAERNGHADSRPMAWVAAGGASSPCALLQGEGNSSATVIAPAARLGKMRVMLPPRVSPGALFAARASRQDRAPRRH